MPGSACSTKSNWFWHFVKEAKERFLYENSSFNAFIGERRSGKSVACLGMAAAIDPNFTEEQICFSIEDLKQQLNTKQQAAIIWEEASTSAYSRDFMTERNKAIIKALQVYGFRKIALLGNFQHLRTLDADLRLQLNTVFRMNAHHHLVDGVPVTQTYAEPFIILTDWIQEPGITPFKILSDGVYKPLGGIPIPDMWDFFEKCGVSKTLYKNYLKKKTEYFMEIGQAESSALENSLNTRELKTLVRQEAAYKDLVITLVSEGVLTKKRIADMSKVPVTTLNRWIDSPSQADNSSGGV